MILRRFSAQLRRQDWTAVVIELFVVVAAAAHRSTSTQR